MRTQQTSRREFLTDVGRGMLCASLGAPLVRALDLLPRGDDRAQDGPRLGFGPRDRLVALLTETAPDRLLPAVVKLLRDGTTLDDLVAAAALGNARALGGEDYVGFHTFMALRPARRMALQLPAGRSALPVLKVLYRNAARLTDRGKVADVLQPLPATGTGAPSIADAVHRHDLTAAEAALATACKASPARAFEQLLATVQEACDVHRVVLAHRAWDMCELTGAQHAHTLLRQSLHYCVKNETYAASTFADLRTLLPRLLDQHHLPERMTGAMAVEDAWVADLARILLRATPAQAAEAVAAALAEGIVAEDVGAAIALTANQLMLRDEGRTGQQIQPGKPKGSVHGDSTGIHASDTAHAWRQIAHATEPRTAAASLIVAGYHVARDRGGRAFADWEPRPAAAAVAKVTTREPEALLKDLDGAVRGRDQDQACVVAARYLELGHDADAAFALLLGHALQADGALHAEKYFWTTQEEFRALRPALRGGQLIALARASASQYGTPAPGMAEAEQLLRA